MMSRTLEFAADGGQDGFLFGKSVFSQFSFREARYVGKARKMHGKGLFSTENGK